MRISERGCFDDDDDDDCHVVTSSSCRWSVLILWQEVVTQLRCIWLDQDLLHKHEVSVRGHSLILLDSS